MSEQPPRAPRGGGTGHGIVGVPVLGDPGPRPADPLFDTFSEETYRQGLYIVDLTIRPEVSEEVVQTDRRRRILGADRIFGGLEGFVTATAPPETISFASRPWISPAGATTRGGTAISARVEDVQVIKTAPINPSTASRIVSTQATITLANRQGALDWLPSSYSIRGLDQTVWYGPRRRGFDRFVRRFTGIGLGFRGGDETLRLEFEQKDPRLTAFVSPRRWTGDRTVRGGDADLRNIPIPLGLGDLFNIPCTRVSIEHEIWQSCQGPMTHSQIKAMGIPYTIVADVETTEELVITALGSDEIATCDREGTFRAGSPLVGVVTADVIGLKVNDSPFFTLAEFAKWVFRTRMRVPTNKLNTGSLAAMPTFRAGFFTGTQEWTSEELLNAIAWSAGGLFQIDADGRWSYFEIKAPETLSTPVPIHIPGQDVQPEPSGLPILSTQRIQYRRNWTGGMAADQISDLITGEERRLLEEPGTEVEAGGLAESARYVDAEPGALISSLYAGPECIGVARDKIALYGRERVQRRINLGRRGYRLKLGQTTAFLGDRYGVENQPWAVIELKEDGAGQSVEALVLGAAVDVDKQLLR